MEQQLCRMCEWIVEEQDRDKYGPDADGSGHGYSLTDYLSTEGYCEFHLAQAKRAERSVR